MKKRFCDEFRVLSWILWGLGFIIGCFVFFGNFYRYNTVTDWGFLMKVILRMFLIPASVHGLIVWLSKKEKPVFVVLGIIVLIPCLLQGLFYGLVGMGFSATFSSHTDDPDDFGVYDEDFQKLLDSRARLLEDLGVDEPTTFPDAIPGYASDVQYTYYFRYGSREECYVAVAWSCPQAEFDAIAAEFGQYEDLSTGNGVSTYHFTEYSEEYYSYLPTAVLLDREACRVAYILADDRTIKQGLPMTMEDVFRFSWE